MKKHDLSMIMRRAWVIARTTGKAFAVALANPDALRGVDELEGEAYRFRILRVGQLSDGVKQMQAGVVRFSYEKADGTLRRALGTLKDVAELIKGTGRPDDGQILRR